MSRKLNCWEFMNCGRERNGLMVDTLGECPVATAWNLDGTNEGTAAGRACWMSFQKASNRLTESAHCIRGNCLSCEFYRRVRYEESHPAAMPEFVVPVA